MDTRAPDVLQGCGGMAVKGVLSIRGEPAAAAKFAERCGCIVLLVERQRGRSKLLVRFGLRGLAKLAIAHSKHQLRCVSFSK